MFARSEFSSPTKAPPPYRNRAIGALALIIAIIVLAFLALSADATVFTPYNATHAATQTFEAQHTQTAVPLHPTPRNGPDDQRIVRYSVP